MLHKDFEPTNKLPARRPILFLLLALTVSRINIIILRRKEAPCGMVCRLSISLAVIVGSLAVRLLANRNSLYKPHTLTLAVDLPPQATTYMPFV